MMKWVSTNYMKIIFLVKFSGPQSAKIYKFYRFLDFSPTFCPFSQNRFFRNNSAPVSPIELIFGYVTPLGGEQSYYELFSIFDFFALKLARVYSWK